MAHSDPEKRRAYNREYQRLYRQRKSEIQSSNNTPVKLFKLEQAPFRIRTAGEVVNLLESTIREVLSLQFTEPGEVLNKARTVGYLAGITLKAIETSDLEGRLIALEEVLSMRRAVNE